jgi:hypothetical protein
MNGRRLTLIGAACVGLVLLPALTAAAKNAPKKRPPTPVTRWIVIEVHGIGDIIEGTPGAQCLGSVDYTYRSQPIKLDEDFGYFHKGAPFYAVWYDQHQCQTNVAGVTGTTDCKSVAVLPVEDRFSQVHILELLQEVSPSWRAEFNNSTYGVTNVCNGEKDSAMATNGIVAPEEGFLTVKYLIDRGVPFKGYPLGRGDVSIPLSVIKSERAGSSSFKRAYKRTFKCSAAGPECDIQNYGITKVINRFKVVIHVLGGTKPPRLPKLVTPPPVPLPLP